MSGIKDLHGLLYWLDNSKSPRLKQVLSNQRPLTRKKAEILRELQEGAAGAKTNVLGRGIRVSE